MESIVASFNATAVMAGGEERSKIRQKIINDMISVIKIGEFYNISAIIKNIDIGSIMLGMILVSEKNKNIKKSYMGSVVTNDIFKFLIATTNNKSLYIQYNARTIITNLITAKKIITKQMEFLNTYAVTYANVSDLEYESRLEWVHEILLMTCVADKSSLLGCMLGKCVGDSLGFIVEGHGPEKCKEFVEAFVETIKIPTWIRCEGLTFGQYSDDSQLARELLVAVNDSKDGVVDAKIYGDKLAGMFNPGNYRIVGYGKTCAEAGEALFNGADYKKTGCTKGHGNGSAMRSAPIGIIFAKESDSDLIDAAMKLSSISHARPRCMTGAAVIALATKFALACKKIKFDINQFIKYICQTDDEELNITIKMIPEILKNNWSNDIVCDYFVKIGLSDGESKWDGISAGVTQTVLWALYCFCKYPNSYIKCIGEAISVGGDVDTTAAIAGAISGTRLGADNIPKNWKHTLHDLSDWDYNELCDLVDNVFTIIETTRIQLKY